MKPLTKGKSSTKKPLIEAAHILIALELILAYFYVLDLFKPSYVILSRGVCWYKVYGLDLLSSGFYTLPPLLVVFAALGVCVYKSGGFKIVKMSKLAGYVLAILAVVNCLPLTYWIAYMWSPQVSQNYSLIRLSELDAGLFHVYAPVYPLLLLATLYAWLPPIVAKTFKKRIRLKVRCCEALNAINCHKPSNSVIIGRLVFTSAILLSVALPVIPYLPSINPAFKPVSVDIRSYSSWLDEMLSRDYKGAIEYAFHGIDNGNRPLYLLMLYGLTNLGVSRNAVLNFEALLITPLFTLTVYYAAKRLSEDAQYASLSSLVATLGFNMTVGMMTGFFAAWTALTLFYLCVALTTDLNRRSLKGLAIALMASIMMLYVHPWTWGLLMAASTIQLVVSTMKSFRKGNGKLNKHLLAFLIGNAFADILKTASTPEYGGLGSSARVVMELSLEQLIHLPRNLQRITTSYVAGLFYNPLHMLLAFMGMLSFLSKHDDSSRLAIIWVALISLTLPFSRIDRQSHLLFATPFPILIAEGLWTLSRLLARFDSKLPRLLQAFFITSSLTYTVRALCNLI